MEIISSGFSAISGLHGHKWVISLWLVLYVIGLYYSLYRKKTITNHEGIRLFSIYSVIQLCIILFPPTAGILVNKFMSGSLQYERLTWGLLFGHFILLTVSMSISDEAILDGQQKVIFIVVFVFFAGSITTNYSYVIPENRYKINNDALRISEYILDDRDPNNRVQVAYQPVFSIDGDVYARNDTSDLYYGIRRYTGDIVLVQTPFDKEKCNENEYAYKDYLTNTYGEGWHTDYIIIENDDDLLTNVEKCGYEQVLSTNYVILCEYSGEVK